MDYKRKIPLKIHHFRGNKGSSATKSSEYPNSQNHSSRNLDSFPPQIVQCTNLTSLSIERNQITSVPHEIFQLKHLKWLNVSYNKLSTLPSEIGLLRELKMLDISRNLITRLPNTLGQLEQLIMFNLSFNELLISIPPTVGLMRSLQVLDTQNCNALEWPPKSVLSENIKVITNFMRGQSFRNLVNNEELSDVTFIVKGKPIRAHRALIYGRYPAFCEEKFQTNIPNQVIEVTHSDMSYELYLSILSYIYNEHIQVSQENIPLLVKTGKKYGFRSLVEYFTENNKKNQDVVISYRIDLSSMINNPKFSDITFEVEGRLIHGHKVVLCARSEYFSKMFLSGMAESSKDVITLPEVPLDAFTAILNEIYSGGAELPKDRISDGQFLVDLLQLADLYDVANLKMLCEVGLVRLLDEENVVTLTILSDMYRSTVLLSECKNFIKNNRKKVELNPEWNQLDKRLID